MTDVVEMIVAQLQKELDAKPAELGPMAPMDAAERNERALNEWDKRVTAWRTVLGPMLIRRELEEGESK